MFRNKCRALAVCQFVIDFSYISSERAFPTWYNPVSCTAVFAMLEPTFQGFGDLLHGVIRHWYAEQVGHFKVSDNVQTNVWAI